MNLVSPDIRLSLAVEREELIGHSSKTRGNAQLLDDRPPAVTRHRAYSRDITEVGLDRQPRRRSPRGSASHVADHPAVSSADRKLKRSAM